MVGILRAWKVSADAGLASAEREARVSELQIGEWESGLEDEDGKDVCDPRESAGCCGSASFVEAIWVKRDAKRRRRSAGG